MPRLSKTWLKRAVVGCTSLLLLAFGLIGFAHTKAGRPLLGWLRGAPGCPLSLDSGDPKAVEAFRVKQLELHTGTLSTRSNRALAFELGRTRRAQVYQWAAENTGRCRSLRDNSVLQCNGPLIGNSRNPPESNISPAIDDIHLQFDERGVLVAVDLYRVEASAEASLALVKLRSRELDQAVGPRTETSGEETSRYLAAGLLHRISVGYRYRQYVAEISATNFGERGIRVREQYQWLPDTKLVLNSFESPERR